MKRFLIQLLCLTAIAGVGIWFWNKYAPDGKQLNHLWFLLIFFTAITAIVHNTLVNAAEKKPAHFIRTFMAVTAFKLLLYLFMVVVYHFVNPSGTVVFLMGFLVFYLIYTVFEVASILRFFKKP